jgi:ABC-type amino acid transport substrate-binding protein
LRRHVRHVVGVVAVAGHRPDRKSGELRVGTSGTQPPLSATAKDGSLMGFDIEIANAWPRRWA